MSTSQTLNPDSLRRLDRIGRVSRIMAHVSLVSALGLPALLIGVAIVDPNAFQQSLATAMGLTTSTLPALTWSAIALLAAGPVLLAMAALLATRSLFRGFGRGEILTPSAGRRLRRIGMLLLTMVPVGVVARAAASVVASWSNPVGERHLAITFGSHEISLVIAGALVIVLGWTLEEAASIADENRQFV